MRLPAYPLVLFRLHVRLLVLAACGVLAEVGWLAMWPLSVALSHSGQFTTTFLQLHPLVGQLHQLTLTGVRWAVPTLPDAPLADPLGSAAYQAPAIALAAVLLWLAATYLMGLIALDRGLANLRAALWVVIGGAIAFQATLLFLPGLLSQDVFGYIAYGRLAAVYSLNPYIWPPSVLRDPVVGWVADSWRTYATPYGPVWVDLQWAIARVSSGLSIPDQALVYRLFANALLLVNLGLAWRLLGRLTPLSPAQRTTALAALAWNPLLLLEIAANAHNDALMIGFSFLGLLLFTQRSRGVAASAALAMGALVKYLSGLGLLWLALASAARAQSLPRRAARVLAIGVTAFAVLVLAVMPWLELPDSIEPLLTETAGVGYVNSLPDALVVLLANGLSLPLDGARIVERVGVWTVFVVYLGWEAWRVWSDPGRGTIARALARSTLVYVLLVSTSMQTWYLCLPVSLSLALGWRRRLSQITLGYAALALPALYLSYYLRGGTPGWVYVVYAIGPWLPLARDLVARGRPAAAAAARSETAPRGDITSQHEAPLLR